MSLSAVFSLVAVLPAKPGFPEALKFLLAGFSVVMLTLLALAVVCSVVGFLFRTFPALAGPKETKSAPPPPAAIGAVDANTIAVIGAAVDQALGGRYRIKSVAPISKK